MSDKPLSYSFPPLIGTAPKVLVLGSMPGVASLEAQRYYAHPRNAFWPIMAALFNVDKDAPYPERCQQLTKSGIAVWDVLKACHRPGSLDQHIAPESIKTNDFATFFRQYPTLRVIGFNGTKAEALYRRHVLPELSATLQSLTYIKLPSTSPAHAAASFQQKLAQWQLLSTFTQ
jgi:hypoxanthine-DNA glycosylase